VPEKWFISGTNRDIVIPLTLKTYQDKLGVWEFFSNVTCRYCVYVALTLALHPRDRNTISVLHWSGVPHIADSKLWRLFADPLEGREKGEPTEMTA
jgi:hypothetical protein